MSKITFNKKVTAKNVTIGDKHYNMKKVKDTITLTLLERVILPSILKKEADYKTLIINKDVQKKIEVTQEEVKKYEIKATEDRGLNWNQKGLAAKFEYDFTEMEKLEIKLALTKMDEEKKLTSDYVSLYDKFVK